MARRTPNFLDAFTDYADNGFAPRIFHKWSGISIIAGALERKVWLPWDDTFSYYPNLFIFLVAHPGIGKSSALDKATGLLQEMNRISAGGLHFVPSQVTEAKFIDLMSRAASFEIGSKITYHSSGYYFASEASNSLKNLFGDFIACMTDFYDCPKFWEKATVKDGTRTLNNVCFNLIAGTTFDYLGKIVTDANVMGGFASRVTYVMFRDKLIRNPQFQGGEDVESPERLEFRQALLADLADIHSMVGRFTGTPEFGKRFEAWYPTYETERQNLESEKMQSLMVRKQTTIFKLCMVLSASESSDRVLREHHWDRAVELLDSVETDLPGMLRESKAGQTQSQLGLMQAIFSCFPGGRDSEATATAVRNSLHMRGFKPQEIEGNLAYMIKNGSLANGAAGAFKLLVDPDSHL